MTLKLVPGFIPHKSKKTQHGRKDWQRNELEELSYRVNLSWSYHDLGCILWFRLGIKN